MLLDLIYRQDAPERPQIERAAAERMIAEVRELGFSCVHRAGPASERSSLSVPVLAGGDTLAALSVRFARSAVTQPIIMERFLPALRQAAHGIVDCFNRSSPPSAPKRAAGAAWSLTET
jgi:DNA-binding IclR family transcriptional regulator